MFFCIEIGLSALSVALAFACPELGTNWFQPAEQLINRLAQKRGLSVLVVGLAALAARAALLPILPVPQPGGHDDYGYLLLADTFAHGRLTNPTHLMWVHFESFHIIWQPTYTAMFYPAQGLIMALGQVIMGHPFWGVWLSLGLMCAAICWMLQGWLPPGWALLGGLLAVIRLGTFSYWANSYFGGTVAAAGGALVLGALPRIQRSEHVRDALLMGVGFAVVAGSRPYEGLIFGLLVAGALGVWMFGKRPNPHLSEENPGPPPSSLLGEEEIKRKCKRVVAPLFLMLLLIGCAMGYYSWRTTGSPWDPPYLVNLRTYNPAPYLPWQSLNPLPVYHHEVFREYYISAPVARYKMARSIVGFFGMALNVPTNLALFYLGPVLTLPLLLALAMTPYGFSWKKTGCKTKFLLLVSGVAAVVPMVPIRATWFLAHHAAPVACAILALVLQAMRYLRSKTWHGKPTGLFITRAVPLICLVTFVLRAGAKPLHIPEPRRYLEGGVPSWCALTPTNLARAATLAKLQHYPGGQLAIVHYGPHHDIFFHEWVYNEADIDRAKVVWARDMGPVLNKELVDCFQDRHVWLVEADETPPRVFPYGTAP